MMMMLLAIYDPLKSRHNGGTISVKKILQAQLPCISFLVVLLLLFFKSERNSKEKKIYTEGEYKISLSFLLVCEITQRKERTVKKVEKEKRIIIHTITRETHNVINIHTTRHNNGGSGTIIITRVRKSVKLLHTVCGGWYGVNELKEQKNSELKV